MNKSPWLLAGRITALDRQTGQLIFGATTVWLPAGHLAVELRPGMDVVVTVEPREGRGQVTAIRRVQGPAPPPAA